MVKALIIIDMIRAYTDAYNHEEIVKNQLELINAFNERKLPVIIVGCGSSSDNKPNPVMVRLWGDEGHEQAEKGTNKLISELLNKPAKYLVKHEYDAFFKTELEEYCTQKHIDELYFCGVYSGVCVYFSAAGAAMRRIQPYLVTDAASTGGEEWHKKNCDDFKTMLGPLITTKEVIEEIYDGE